MSIYAYGIIIAYGCLLAAVRFLVMRKFPRNNLAVREFILAGGSIPFGLLAPSVFVSWIWTTTIVGSAEAGVLYGISGGWAYSLGAIIAFGILIALIVKIRRLMPGGITFLDFAGSRYSPLMRDVFMLFSVLVIIYLTAEQAAGIALVFDGIFGVSFKMIAFFTVMLAGVYVVSSGLRGVLYNELFNFFIISIGILAFAAAITGKFDLGTMYEGLKQVQSDPSNVNYNPEALDFFSRSGIMYAFSAIIIALGQICLDPAYYVKSYIAKDEKTMIRSFVVAGILFWTPVAVISAFVIGYVSLSENIDLKSAVNLSIDLSTKILQSEFAPQIQLLFAALIFCIGITSIIHCLVGIQSIFTIGFYSSKLNPGATELEQLRFGRTVAFMIAFLCALIAISLENVSLLTIDTFSGIFFAATCGATFAGILSGKEFGSRALVSIIAGIIAGFVSWGLTGDADMKWFYGSLYSFAIPIALMFILSVSTGRRFNFMRLLMFRYDFEKENENARDDAGRSV